MITISQVETFDYAAGTFFEQTPAQESNILEFKTKIVFE